MPQRRGFTLVEVLVALVIMGIVTGAIYRLLNTSQRVTLAQAEQMTLQSNVRTGSLVVPNELRELNTWSGAPPGPRNDVIEALPSTIRYRAMRGLGFVCQAPGPGATQLSIAANSWTGIRDPDWQRDDLYLFIDGNVDDAGDDAWLPVTLTGASVKLANECGANDGYRLTAAAFPQVPVNTPVRLYEEMRLQLYADAGKWWLGARSMKVPGSVLQPVLGPLTSNGLALEYLNINGNPTAALDAITSIRVTVRGLTDDEVRAGGGSGAMGHAQEALATQVLLRNSIRP